MRNFSFTLNERQPQMTYVNFGNKYDNNVHFEDVRFICPHLVIIHISKIRVSAECYTRKMKSLIFIRHNAMHCKKPGGSFNCTFILYLRP